MEHKKKSKMKTKVEKSVITWANHPTVTERWISCETIRNKRAGFEVFVIPTGTPKSIIKQIVGN
jgi:hypothetical protein